MVFICYSSQYMKNYRFASYKKRFLAFCIDFLCLSMVVSIFNSFHLFRQNKSLIFAIIYFLCINIFFWLILTILEWSPIHTSIGKGLLGLKVEMVGERKYSCKRMLLRNGLKVFTFSYITLLLLNLVEINNLFLIGVFLSVSTNAIWHDFLTVIGEEKHNHRLVHDEIVKTKVVEIS